jgi:hypothetical protein
MKSLRTGYGNGSVGSTCRAAYASTRHVSKVTSLSRIYKFTSVIVSLVQDSPRASLEARTVVVLTKPLESSVAIVTSEESLYFVLRRQRQGRFRLERLFVAVEERHCV